MKIWLLVFLFNGQPAVSGPHRLDVCLDMAKDQVRASCWHAETMQRHRERPGSAK